MVGQVREVDVLIVGAGFAGMYAIHRLRGLGFSIRAIEKGDDVGGTWYWNRYPGARCDIESMSYSYSFSDELQQEWRWSHRYATQPEILRYARHVADKFDLRRDIQFGTQVTDATYDESAAKWAVTTDRGERFLARFLIMATGCLSVPKKVDVPGLDSFAGDVFHTADWPREGVDFTGRRVGIIGTGSSGIQSIPLIAQAAEYLTVFQRTANFSVPAWNAPMSDDKVAAMKRDYASLRRKSRNSYAGDYAEEAILTIMDLSPEDREAAFEKCWQQGGFNIQYFFTDVMESAEANRLAADFVRRKIRATVRDPKVAELLCPRDHPLGAKRLCVDTGYYETYNRDNVTLVDIHGDPIQSITPDGLKTGKASYSFDTLVLATGFDAFTGALQRIEITGRQGRKLSAAWADGATAYLGMAVAGFPNMFIVTGPGSPSVLANVLLAGEQHVEWISTLIDHARAQQIGEIEAEPAAQEGWARQVWQDADRTLYPRAQSWYIGANVPGKPHVFLAYVAGFKAYCDQCDEIARQGYAGFRLRMNAAA
ncbi:MAG: NAD(P)/FAD-dependent oxidoreductase [Rhodospirillaceae bacterium]|nr:NAD(P)/FAD-dependent oxidoreductase [Rhodospirillaceae bacterium]